MTAPRQPQPEQGRVPAATTQQEKRADKQEDELDEALDESFPASDPVAVSITVVDVPSPAR